MADEKVVIKIDIDASVAPVEKLRQEIKRLEKEQNKFSSKASKAGDSYGSALQKQLDKSGITWKKHFDGVDEMVKDFGKGLTKFLMLAIKGVVLEMAVMAASMIGIHALFAAGRFLVKAYHGAMQLAATGFAAIVTGASLAAAAIREQQAAMYAYRGRGAKEFGSGMAQARVAMRNLAMDSDLAGLGVKNLNAAYAVMAKTMSTPQINASNELFKNLMDFGAAGQDPGKAAAKVGQVIADLSNNKKNLSQVLASAKAISPEVAIALKKTKVTSKQMLKEMITSGELAKLGGVSGQFDAVNNTIMAKIKTFMALVKGQFGDFGQQFLGPAKVALQKIYKGLNLDLQKIFGAVSGFSSGKFMDGLVTVVDKLAGFFVHLVQVWLPRAQNTFGGISKWWQNLTHYFKVMVDKIRPLVDGAKVLEKAFVPIWHSIKKGGVANFKLFREELLKNQDVILETGTKIAALIDSVSKFAQNMKKALFSLLPFINSLIGGLTDAFGMLGGALTSGGGGTLLAAAVLGKKMSSTKGGFLPGKMGAMNVTANAVYVNGQPVGPSGGVASGPTKVSSGATGASSPGNTYGVPRGAGGVAGMPSSVPPIGYVLPHQLQPSNGYVPTGRYEAPERMIGPQLGETMPTRGERLKGFLGRGSSRGNRYGTAQLDEKNLLGMRRNLFKNREGTQTLNAGWIWQDGQHRDLGTQDFKGGSGYAHGPDPFTSGQVSNVGYVQNQQLSYMNAAKQNLQQNGIGGVGKQLLGKGHSAFSGMMGRGGEIAINPLTGKSLASEAGFNIVDQDKNSKTYEQEIKPYIGMTKNNWDLNKTNNAGVPIGVRPKFAKTRDVMRMARYNRNYSRGAQMAGKFNNSASGRMGTSLGLGLLATKGPEEMRGAMAAGAVVGQMDPTLGIAVAGIGGAMKAKGAGKGAISGGIGGAALGMKLGGPWGAAIGAALGVVAGGIMGGINKVKAQAAVAKKAIMSAVGNMMTGIAKDSYRLLETNIAKVEAGGNTKDMKGSFEGFGASFSSKYDSLLGQAKSALVETRLPGAGDNGLARETGKNKSEFSTKAAGNTFIDLANSFVNPMQSATSVLGAMVPDIMNVGALIGKIPGAEKVGSLFNSGIGKGIKATLGFNVKSERRGNEEAFLKDLKAKGLMTEEELKNAMGNTGEAVNKFVKELEDRKTALTQIDKVNTDRLDQLEKMTGKTRPELEKLAKEMGVNLYDATIKFDDMVTKLKINMVKSAAEMQAANQNSILNPSDIFSKEIEKEKASYAMNDKARALHDKFTAGGGKVDNKSLYEYLQGAQGDYLTLNKGKGAAAFFDMQNSLGAGGAAFQQGHALSGMESTFTSDPLYQKYVAEQKSGLISNAAGQLQALAQEKGQTLDANQLTTQMNAMDPQKLKNMLLALENGTFMNQSIGSADSAERGKNAAIEDVLVKSGFTNLTMDKYNKPALDAVADNMTEATDGFKKAVEEFGNFTNDVFKSTSLSAKPEWWDQKPSWWDSKDTSSPRGRGVGDTTSTRLGQTMARHNAINSQLTGTRSITSSYRTYALGSPSSDHASGRALDIVGANLGQYAQATRASGGFAEFHGRGGSRHLHVVPGPGAGAIGDTKVPAMMGSGFSGSGGSNTNVNYSITVNGGPGQSPEAIASAVLAKIDARERNYRERM